MTHIRPSHKVTTAKERLSWLPNDCYRAIWAAALTVCTWPLVDFEASDTERSINSALWKMLR